MTNIIKINKTTQLPRLCNFYPGRYSVDEVVRQFSKDYPTLEVNKIYLFESLLDNHKLWAIEYPEGDYV